jgi:hypothetical protein
MSSNDNADDCLDLELVMTPQDAAMLRQLRAETPTWLQIDWRVLAALVPPGALDRRPIADDRWRPFVLDADG